MLKKSVRKAVVLTGFCLDDIEISDEQEDFVLPPWVGREVSGDRRFYNSGLSRLTFTDLNSILVEG